MSFLNFFRFPNSEFLQAFASLGMRQLSVVSESEISDWGNESIQRLADFYGSEQQHVYKDPNTKETQVWQKFIKISTYYKQITTA